MTIFKKKKMDKKQLKEFQELLEKEKKELEDKIADLNLKEKDMAIKMPDFTASEDSSIEADEIEELNNLLSLKLVWEGDLARINDALERMKAGTYGICEECGELIEEARLRIEPAAQICAKCLKKKNTASA
ncbi:MAG TPA: TraR/DksA C4-type zinc finger protein [Candidatus Paceibacterota bacterium]|nr:TraR/DksA C4-type zinc finger protein [Candidatus Paceibacterota bacterium]HOL54095.1 TraR/DksA C4-type zinc finger protein [Candidatus Paceibacterota bacterium]HON21814.1 TraR/DksA C4-type zinc finger protein [Candidatus Paceibacterota bacterium]HPP17125.1 TraR/DksA C4-type zinc finger protein [Candidatus Paceibacterota bacterium]HRU33748.1 TraR/DksA C4-type zinc finger protein [Candidatus Paceibacterota bacterium]